MVDAVEVAIVALLWAVAVRKVTAAVISRQHRLVYWALIALGVTGTLNLPMVNASVDGWLHSANVANFVGNNAGLVAMACTREAAAEIIGSARRRGWALRQLAVVLPMLTALFVLAPVHRVEVDHQRYADFTVPSAGHPLVLAYWLVFASCLGVGFVGLAGECWTFARAAGRSTLGVGVSLLVASAVVGLCYLAHSTVVVLASAFGVGGALISTSVTVTNVLVALLTGLALAGGYVLPGIGEMRLRTAVRTYRTLRVLYPLWERLRQATPDIALAPMSAARDALTLRDLDMRLYRRVIEIHDGYLALTPYVDARHRLALEELAGRYVTDVEQRRLVVDAALFELALVAKLAGQRARTGTAPPPIAGGANLSTEIQSLRTITHHQHVIDALARHVPQLDD